ncbi:hypothetical protein MUY14_14305 [Amycolatopsis sp. FBCC-B4732]|uniref:hypothetical protein n=1 Tax=unclassified Amycolatopsis TaxID=2618356 RepID=UPI001FF29E01|nr:hypothetical protein [Amycolatopsis sp. FBCC-B4732]UOX91740.1 hypothetical protein MUY14_14305 [Amycolatopsis sp. FBCC-B4732]
MPEPILISIAAALAAKGATGLYDLVKRKFAKDPAATLALEAAASAPSSDTQPIRALAERLESAGTEDREFAEALRTEWEKLPEGRVTYGGVHNTVTGTVTGKVIQAGDVHGNINL